MKFFSKDKYINTKLSMSSFKKIKEKKLKVALQNLSDFGFVPDVEVFNADDEKVYVKDNVGTIYPEFYSICY